MNLKELLASIAALLAGVAAFIASPQWPMAALLLVLIVISTAFGLWVRRHIISQDAAIAECTKDRAACREDLHKRDKALAVLWVKASQNSGGKRPGVPALRDLLGEDADHAIDEAETITGFRVPKFPV